MYMSHMFCCREMSEILVANIELYRRTCEAVAVRLGASSAEGSAAALDALPADARESMLQTEMLVSGNLHAALCTPGNHYKVRGA